jgi:F1F0 ATPase subunit 2
MTESIGIVLPSLAVGLALGAVYFGGLWFSVRHLLVLEHAAAWFAISFLARALIVLFGFYWTMDGHWERLIVAMLGFGLVRVLFSNLFGKKLRSGA